MKNIKTRIVNFIARICLCGAVISLCFGIFLQYFEHDAIVLRHNISILAQSEEMPEDLKETVPTSGISRVLTPAVTNYANFNVMINAWNIIDMVMSFSANERGEEYTPTLPAVIPKLTLEARDSDLQSFYDHLTLTGKLPGDQEQAEIMFEDLKKLQNAGSLYAQRSILPFKFFGGFLGIYVAIKAIQIIANFKARKHGDEIINWEQR